MRRGIDYEAMIKYYAQKRAIEIKRRRERRKKVAYGLFILFIVVVSIYLFYPEGNGETVVGNFTETTNYSLTVPPSVKAVFDGREYVISFTVSYTVKPPSILVLNALDYSVDPHERFSKITVRFDRFSDVPDSLVLSDGENVYRIPVEKFVFATIPDSGISYPAYAVKGSKVEVGFYVKSDGMIDSPRVLVFGAKFKVNSMRLAKSGDYYVYHFSVSLLNITNGDVAIVVSGKNLATRLEKKLAIKLVERKVTIEKDFDEPVVVPYGKKVAVTFSVFSNLDEDATVTVSGVSNATYDREVHLSPGSPTQVFVTIPNSGVGDAKKETGVLSLTLEDGSAVECEFDVILLPKISMKVVGFNVSVTKEGFLNVSLEYTSTVTANAIVEYSSSPVTISDDFPKSVKITKGVNAMNFTIKEYPANANRIDVYLKFELDVFGVSVGEITFDLRINIK